MHICAMCMQCLRRPKEGADIRCWGSNLGLLWAISPALRVCFILGGGGGMQDELGKTSCSVTLAFNVLPIPQSQMLTSLCKKRQDLGKAGTSYCIVLCLIPTSKWERALWPCNVLQMEGENSQGKQVTLAITNLIGEPLSFLLLLVELQGKDVEQRHDTLRTQHTARLTKLSRCEKLSTDIAKTTIATVWILTQASTSRRQHTIV